MQNPSTHELVRAHAHVLENTEDYSRVLAEVGDASLVLLGEATHGTREFYEARADISERLITEKGFDAIAVEADWPDALRVSRFIQHNSDDQTADQALGGFERFPRWMWRNEEVVKLIYWLHQHNGDIAQPERRIGFFGLDLYSLRKSMDAVIRYLDQVDPAAAKVARARYSCFDHLAEDPQHYGYAASFGLSPPCEEEVARQLMSMTKDAASFLRQDGQQAGDELFYAQQNARVALNAENYYRAMFRGRDESWNVRDQHMAETLHALREHLSQRKGSRAKIIVWAHNSHIGDARATEMGEHGQLNLGQLVRERYPAGETCLIGFTTHTGAVTAASDWDAAAELKAVRPSRADSIEGLMHDAQLGNFLLPLHNGLSVALAEPHLERAIGVIYLPKSERASHYFHARLSHQFDAVIHIDTTTAVKPLDHSPAWVHEEVPDTYPFGV